MEPNMAARAAQSVRARTAIPHHFGTSPDMTQTAAGFAAELKKRNIAFYEMKRGETVRFPDRRREHSGLQKTGCSRRQALHQKWSVEIS
jgi:L-ascorbate metabolism protein UlaG (beta-lactamase superfamily)